jgi:hypothetical protein
LRRFLIVLSFYNDWQHVLFAAGFFIVQMPVVEVGDDDQRAAKLIKEFRQELQEARTGRELNRSNSIGKQQRWPKTDQEYMTSSRAPSRASNSSDRGRYDEALERPTSGLRDDYAGQRTRALKTRTEDDYSSLMSQQRPAPEREFAGGLDRLQRSKTDMSQLRDGRPAVPQLGNDQVTVHVHCVSNTCS